MEKPVNLEALTEVDGEYSDTESEDDDDELQETEKNKFDNLCDGVVNSLAIVHSSMAELLEMKDELIRHALPANALMHITLTVTKVFRGVSDMYEPIQELLRLVRLYSTPWEEKSAALKKLHDDYNSKKDQLSVAIKKLQLIDQHSKNIARERRVMNWEHLFSRLTTQKAHGRRWKFRISAFKKHASLGPEAFNAYMKKLEKQDEQEEEEEKEDEKEIQTQVQNVSTSSASESEYSEEEEDEEEDKSVKTEAQSQKTSSTPLQQKSPVPPPVAVPVAPPVVIRPPARDVGCWTNEPNYNQELVVRLYRPTDMSHKQIRCNVTYGNTMMRTDVLDPPPPKEEEEEVDPADEFQELHFPLPSLDPIIRPRGFRPIKMQLPEHLQISVHAGALEDMVAMATIDMSDLESLDLPEIDAEDDIDSFELDPIDFPVYGVMGSGGGHDPVGQLPLTLYWYKHRIHTHEQKSAQADSIRDIVLQETGYDLHTVTMDDLHPEMRDISLSAMSFHKDPTPTPEEPEETQGEVVTQIVEIPVMNEDVVSKQEVEELKEKHEQEMQELQDLYESKIQDILAQFQNFHESLEEEGFVNSPDLQHLPQIAPHTPVRSKTNQTIEKVQISELGRAKTEIVGNQKPRKRKKAATLIGSIPTYGQNLPADFLDRLAWFSLASQQHQLEVTEKLLNEEKEKNEKVAAAKHHISKDTQSADPTADVSLPAVFMSQPSSKATVFNPRAAKYFHPSGGNKSRLTQPPSMLSLPPLKQNRMGVLNLFEVSQNFRKPPPQQLIMERVKQASASTVRSGKTPAGIMRSNKSFEAVSVQGNREPELE